MPYRQAAWVLPVTTALVSLRWTRGSRPAAWPELQSWMKRKPPTPVPLSCRGVFTIILARERRLRLSFRAWSASTVPEWAQISFAIRSSAPAGRCWHTFMSCSPTTSPLRAGSGCANLSRQRASTTATRGIFRGAPGLYLRSDAALGRFGIDTGSNRSSRDVLRERAVSLCQPDE
jgi:hypothetical protein